MGFFDAFYVMSYTATTIGFGEIPYPFTYNQRMWVTISIYLTVIGWAYAIGSLLALLQDRSFRSALALQRFTPEGRPAGRAVRARRGLRAGGGAARALDGPAGPPVRRPRHGRPERIDGLELESYHADVPGLAADVRDPGHLGVAGLGHASCEAVVALTDDDEANLSVVMSAALLRPDVPVIARATSRAMADRMRAFGTPSVVNPFDVLRRPPPARPADAGRLPAADLAGERAGRRAPVPRLTAPQRPVGRLRVRAARPGADRGPARRGPRRHRHRAPARRRRRREPS